MANSDKLDFTLRAAYENAGSPVHRLQAETHQNVLFCKPISAMERNTGQV